MARRRLTGANPEFLDGPLETKSAVPIARVAGETAAAAALEELSLSVKAAREKGLLITEIPIHEIDETWLNRDRLDVSGEAFEALVKSIAGSGQRTAVEVMATPQPEAEKPFALISGWRRMTALRAIGMETVKAIIRQPKDQRAAYIAMVEENEIRLDLSYFERARVAVMATRAGAFPDPGKAILALFSSASRAKRSKIRSFTRLVEALGGALRFPEALPERLGLQMAERLKDERSGFAGKAIRALMAAKPETAAEELAVLQDCLTPDKEASEPANAPEEREIRPGVTLSVRRSRQKAVLTLSGPGVKDALIDELAARLG